MPVTWLGGTPAPVAVGVSFGVPWPRGAVQKSQAFALTTADGKALPVQTWPLAFWPDGSLKWSGVATVAGPSTTGEFKLTATPSAAATDGAKISIRRSDTTYTIDTGRANFVIPMHGSNLIDAITVEPLIQPDAATTTALLTWLTGLRLWHQARVIRHPDGAPFTIDRYVFVSGISHTITPDSWTMGLDFQSATLWRAFTGSLFDSATFDGTGVYLW